MSDLRDLLERGVRGFHPDPGEALDTTRRRAERRHRNRRVLAGVVALALVAGSFGGLWAAFRQRGDLAAPPPAPDPAVVGEVRLGRSPTDILVAGGRAWALLPRGGSEPARLVEVDAETLDIIGVRSAFNDPIAMTAAFGDLFVVDAGLRAVLRLDAASGAVTDRYDLPENLLRGGGIGTASITDSGGEILVVLNDPQIIVHVDPDSGAISQEGVSGRGALVDVHGVPGGRWLVFEREVRFEADGEGASLVLEDSVRDVAVAGDHAWVLWAQAGLQRFDPGEGLEPPVPAGIGHVFEMVESGGVLWLLAFGYSDDYRVIPFDAMSGERIGEGLGFGEGGGGVETSDIRPGYLASGEEALWVADLRADSLVKIAPFGGVAVDPSPDPSNDPGTASDCPRPAVEATYLPRDVRPRGKQVGMGGDADPDGQFTNVVHWGDSPGPDGDPAPFLEAWAVDTGGGPLIPANFAENRGTAVQVLGETGYLVAIEDGWGVFAAFGDGPCEAIEIHAYGPSRAETRRFAEGLEPSRRLVGPPEG